MTCDAVLNSDLKSHKTSGNLGFAFTESYSGMINEMYKRNYDYYRVSTNQLMDSDYYQADRNFYFRPVEGAYY